MKHRYKPLGEQVIVITGASSGIGLATARRAAKRGARLVLASRNETVLKDICEDIRAHGGDAIYVVADVGVKDQVQNIAAAAIQRYGGFDTWVNNAGVVVFSHLDDLPIEEHKRLFDTNYWGVVYGSEAAVAHMRHRPDGGTIINVASINAEMPVPILGAYSASKAAVKAYSEVLRMEMIHEDAPIKITVLKPSGIATPISDHGRSHTGHRGKVMPPLYDVEVVASAILTAAQRPVRNITIGETGRLSEIGWAVAPSLFDRVIAWALPRVQSSDQPPLERDNLFQAGEDGEVYLEGKRAGIPVSPYTQLRINRKLEAGLGVALIVTAGAFIARRMLSR